MYASPFRPNGSNSSILLSLTTAPITALALTSGLQGDSLRVTNLSSVPVWLQVGSSSISGVLPTSGAPTAAFPMQGSGVETFSVGGSAQWLTAMTSAATATVVITAGFGS